MSKKLSFIIFILFLILGGVFGYLYFNSGSSRSSETGAESSSDTDAGGGGFPTVESRGGSSETGAESASNTGPSSSELLTPSSVFGASTSGTNALRQIVTVPVAGATSYVDIRGQVVVRYIERESGRIYDQPIQEKAPSKVTDTTIPKIFDALFGRDGKVLVFQSMVGKTNELNTAFAEIKKTPPLAKATSTKLIGEENLSTTVGMLDGSLLPGTVHFVAASPDKTSYLYLSESREGSTAVIIPGEKTKLASSLTTVFTSKLTEWMPDWPSKDTVTFTTRAGSGLPGTMYRVNTTTKQKTPVLSAVLGLTTRMSADGSRVIYAEASGSGFITRLRDVKSASDAVFSLRTLPEKCVWSRKTPSVLYCAVPSYIPPGAYPDDWYAGQTRFNDTLWKVNTATGETSLLASAMIDSKDSLDAVKLFFDEAEKNLFWINKRDSTVWTVSLP